MKSIVISYTNSNDGVMSLAEKISQKSETYNLLDTALISAMKADQYVFCWGLASKSFTKLEMEKSINFATAE